jgi:hypothetical protein
MHTDREALTAAALALAGRAWRVFPLLPGDKRPAFPNHSQDRCDRTDWWCRHGHLGWEPRATVDRDRIVRCWATTGWNIGVAAGPSGLVVVDLDVPKPGQRPPDEWALLGITCGADVFAELAARARQPMPVTFTVATPSGGRHLYFTAPAGARLRNTAGTLGWRVDTRAHGGYVVGPGSTTPAGAYTIVDERPPVVLPAWLTHPLAFRPAAAASAAAQSAVTRQDSYLGSILDREAMHVQRAPAGQHNAALFSAALVLGQLVAGGALPEHIVRTLLVDAARGHITGPCDCTEAQARRTITSGLGYGVQRPRHVPAIGTTHSRAGGGAA